MSSRVIRIADIASTKNRAGLLPVSPNTIWRWVREGHFPKPYKLGPCVTVWDAEAIDAFIATRGHLPTEEAQTS